MGGGRGGQEGEENPNRECCVKVLIGLLVTFILCAVGVLAAALYFGQFYAQSPPGQIKGTSTDKHVLVLGAGLAGLRAAEILDQAGIKFTIIEGSDRIGGRIKSAMIGGKRVETGATWIQGTVDNPIWKLAEEVQLVGKVMDYESYVVRDEAGLVVTDEADNQYEVFDEAVDKVGEVQQKLIQEKLPDQSLKDSLAGLGWVPTSPVQNIIEIHEYDGDIGDSPNNISTKHLDSNGELYGDQEVFVTDQRGLGIIVERLKSRFLDRESDSRLVLNEVVSSISYNEDKAKVATKSGKIYEGDFVLVTFSLGVLKTAGNDLIFNPALPDKKMSAIEKYRMINYLEIYLKFPNVFWDADEFLLYASSDRGRYPIWLNLNFPGLLNDSIIMVNVVGDEALRVIKLQDVEIQNEIMGILRNLYGSSIPDPEEILVPRWDSDPLFMGSFPVWPIGMTDEDFLAYKAPVGRVHFAGDAASRLYGYMQGAYNSGEEEARGIITCIQTENCKSYDYNGN